MTRERFPTHQPAVITVGLLYANGPIHIGHLRGYVAGDVLARALRTIGQETVFISGSDVHGTPVALNAAEADKSPETYALEWHRTNKATFPKFNIEFDYYGHTREPGNQELTADFVRAWEQAGHVVEKTIEVTWDPELDQPLPDRFVEGTCPYCGADARGDECDEGCQRHLGPGEIQNPRSALTGTPAELRSRPHKFLRLRDFQDDLVGFLDRLEGTENARKQPRAWVEGELHDLCITRDLSWGVPYPDDPLDRVLYVWVDAPIAYVSGTRSLTELPEYTLDWLSIWRDDQGEVIHVIGQDIIQQHTIFWPAMLRGAGYADPRAICATGFVTLDGRGLSTSRGHAVWADDYLDTGLHPDLLRYYLVTESSIQRDLDFTWERFAERINTELVGHCGNFIHRSLLLAHRHWDGTPIVDPGDDIVAEIQRAVDEYAGAVNAYDIKRLGDIPVTLARFGNRYIQRAAPWQALDRAPDDAAQVVRDCLQLCKAVIVLLAPVVPGIAAAGWSALGESGAVHRCTHSDALEPPPPSFDQPSPLVEPVTETDLPAG